MRYGYFHFFSCYSLLLNINANTYFENTELLGSQANSSLVTCLHIYAEVLIMPRDRMVYTNTRYATLPEALIIS